MLQNKDAKQIGQIKYANVLDLTKFCWLLRYRWPCPASSCSCGCSCSCFATTTTTTTTTGKQGHRGALAPGRVNPMEWPASL